MANWVNLMYNLKMDRNSEQYKTFMEAQLAGYHVTRIDYLHAQENLNPTFEGVGEVTPSIETSDQTQLPKPLTSGTLEFRVFNGGQTGFVPKPL